MRNINYEMEDAANAYLNLLNDENIDRRSSKDRRDNETQIYWESENLQLERQKKMGITETFDLASTKLTKKQIKAGVTLPKGTVVSVKEGNVRTGKSYRLLDVNRKIWKDEAMVKQFQSSGCDCNVSLLQSDVNETDQVACPNCGAYGTIESFVDGCDYCGSHFEVKDFKAKVSGFSLIESVDRMMTKVEINMTKAYLIIFMVVWSLGFFSPLILWLIGTATGDLALQNGFVGGTFTFNWNGGAAPVSLGFILSALMIKDGLLIPKSFFILFATTIGMSGVRFSQVAFAHKENVDKIIKDFSATEFREEIEHHLKTAMMADTVQQACAYANCDMRAFMEAHSNVFDMNVAKIEFLSAERDFQTDTDGYIIDSLVTVKLYRCKNLSNGKTKICEEYERIHLKVSTAENFQVKKMSAISEYKCPGCGNAMNIFRGNHCTYCGKEFDKHLAGPVIESCTWTKRPNYYRTVPKIIIIAVAVILIL